MLSLTSPKPAAAPTLQAARAPATRGPSNPVAAPCLLRRAVAGAGAALILATVGLPALAADLALGEEVFSNTCAACHAGGANVIEPGKTLQKTALEQNLAGGFDEAAITHQVENGKAVAAYVYNQAANDLW